MNIASSQITLGLIGCGRVTRQLHLPALAHVSSLAVVALADSDPKALEHAANQSGVSRRYRAAEQLIADPEVSAVAICTPVKRHATQGLLALAAGKHAFVEKPLALDVSEGERLVAAAKRSDK